MKPFLAALFAMPIFPTLFWLSGYDFDQRGEKAVFCAIFTLTIMAGAAGIAAIETTRNP